MLLDEALFEAGWRLGLPPWLHTVPIIVLVVAAPLVLWRRTRAPGSRLAQAGGLGALAVTSLAPTVALGTLAFAVLAGGWGLRRAAARLDRRASSEERRFAWAAAIAGSVAMGAAAMVYPLVRPLPANGSGSRVASAYLVDAIALIRRQSLRRDSVDWGIVTDSAFALARGARTTTDTHDALRYVTRALGDHHSAFLPGRASMKLATGPAPAPVVRARSQVLPVGRMLEAEVGYVSVPWFIDQLSDRGQWVARLHSLLDSLHEAGARGWVVDLRSNLGGNMWPMLEGLGSLFGDGLIGGIDMPQWSRRTRWWMFGGRPYSGVPILAVAAWPGRRRSNSRFARDPVAVIIGPLTASSGEAVAIAFQGRPGTRFFGLPTAGLSTANAPIVLRDGAIAVVTIGIDMDRFGRRYGGPVMPDERIDGDGDDAAAPVMRRAAAWVLNVVHGDAPAIPADLSAGKPGRRGPDSSKYHAVSEFRFSMRERYRARLGNIIRLHKGRLHHARGPRHPPVPSSPSFRRTAGFSARTERTCHSSA